MQRRAEFSFQGSPARGALLPPRPRPPGNASLNPMAPRYADEEDRWLQASLQASPDYYSSGGSGTPSPQLWAHAQQARPHHHPELLHRQYPASAGSSPSRAQAIAGYRREMLDLVRGLPESAYELSLRDIVEHHHHTSPSPPSPPRAATSLPSPPPPPSSTAGQQHHASRAVPAGAQEKKDHTGGARKDAVVAAATDADDVDGGSSRGGTKQGRKQRTAMRRQRSRGMERSVSLDTGMLIKLFLPLSVGGKKKVSPKPDAAKDDKKKKNRKEEKKQGKKKKDAAAAAAAPAQEEVWWTNSEFSEAGSNRTSSTGSSNSNSSAASVRNVNGGAGANPRAPARSWSRKRTGCYAFFRPKKGKNGVTQD